jgi:hypothetical protein
LVRVVEALAELEAMAVHHSLALVLQESLLMVGVVEVTVDPQDLD